LGKKTRRNIRRDRKILTEKGPLEYLTYSDTESYKYFDAVIELHKKRWQGEEKQDAFSSKMFLDFHAKVSKLFAEKGWLKIGILINNGQRIAASYHFAYNGTLFAYQVGCDDGYDRRLSVGMAEFGYSIEEAIKGKCKEYDFYKASMKGYKALLAKDCRNVIDVRIARDDFIEKFIDAAKKIKTLLARKRLEQN
jgi:CelD/BcsL family acetyltransferase involved in cellulose biosynthesis